MGLLLKQSTAVDFLAGPFVDDGDGKTPETGLTITAAEVRLSKNGGNMAAKNEATALSHDELGMYVCKLDATDTNTLGTLQVTIYEAGALMVYHEFMVVPANTYDSLIAGSDVLTADVTQIGGVAQSATDLKDFADTGYDPTAHKVQGVVLTDTCTTCTTTTTNTDMVDLSTLEARLSAARAGYLDELAAANLPTDVANVNAAIVALNDISVANVLAGTVDGAVTVAEALAVILASTAGKSSGGGTATIKFRDAGDSKDRITATVDADGNRTAIIIDGS